VKQLVYKRKRQELIVSTPVIGELFSKLPERYDTNKFSEMASKFFKFLKEEKLKTWHYGESNTKVFNIVVQLREADICVTPSDALIIACAIEDKNCTLLYTTDNVILNSTKLKDAIENICEENRREKLRLSEL